MRKLLIKKKRSKKNPFFSVITVVKNDEKNIEKTIKSVAKQSFKNFEYLIIDGKSSDNTIKKIKKYKKKIDFFTSEKDKGIYFAMNKGIKFSKGKVIIFINSGDTFTKGALKIIYNVFKKNKKIDFVFGTVLRKYTKSKILKYSYNVNKLFYNFDFATSHSTGFFLKRKIYNQIGKFNTKYKCSADYDIYFKTIIKKNLIGDSTKINDLIGTVASGGYSSKISFLNHLFEEIQIRNDNNQNKIFLLIIFINAIIKHLLKKIFTKTI